MLYKEGKDPPIARQNVPRFIGHEVSHQWLGNLVTLEWWSSLWLSEMYAMYYEYYLPSQVLYAMYYECYLSSQVQTGLPQVQGHFLMSYFFQLITYSVFSRAITGDCCCQEIHKVDSQDNCVWFHFELRRHNLLNNQISYMQATSQAVLHNPQIAKSEFWLLGHLCGGRIAVVAAK